MTTVYVSATRTDLAHYRDAARSAVRTANCVDVAMEDYVAESQDPLTKCLSDVTACDVYVGIFAFRYGHIPPSQTRSITELEYRKAIQLGKPCFIFLLDEEASWPANYVDRGEDGEKLSALRDDLKLKHLIQFFRTPSDLAAGVTAALMNYKNPASRLTASPVAARAVTTARTWQTYYKRLRQRYLGVEMEALTPRPHPDTLRIPLTSVFLEPYARQDAGGDAQRMAGWRTIVPDGNPNELTYLHTSQAHPPVPLFDLLTDPDYSRTVLLGDPGAGKSANSRYVALSLAKAHNEPRLEALDGHVPLLIELRSYVALLNSGRCSDFIGYLDHRAQIDGLGIGRDELTSYLDDGGRAIVLLDGLDEIFDRSAREDVANQIALFAAEYENVRILVTSRNIGYSQHLLAAAGFNHFTLDDLNELQIDEFLQRWYKEVMPEEPGEADVLRRRMLTAIGNSSAIRELAGNPLLLSILAIIGTDKELPKERWRVYEHAADVLVDYWDTNRHLPEAHDDTVFLSIEDKKKLLRRLAFRMQSQQEGLNPNYIERDQLVKLFEDYLVEQYSCDRPAAHRRAYTMIDQFHERNFILRLYGHEIYGFVHRTFLEFFYVQAVIRRFDMADPQWSVERLKELFTEHWADPSWREVLLLLAGKLDVTVSSQLINLLATEVNRPWPVETFTEPPWNLVLAVQCLAELRDPADAADAAETVLRQVILLIEHGLSIADHEVRAKTEAEILASARVLGTRWPGRLHYLDWYRRRGVIVSSVSGSSFATRIAVLLAKPENLIEDFIEDTLGAGEDRPARLTVIAGLSESLSNGSLDEHGRRARCREVLELHARSDQDSAVRLAAIRALIENFPIDEPLAELLSARVNQQTEIHAAVRRTAIKALGRGRPSDEEIRDLLIATARHDEDGIVRAEAIDALAKHWPDREVHALLMEKIRSDRTVKVVHAAAHGIFESSANRRDLCTLLTRRVRGETLDAIKRESTRLLGELFSDFETQEVLLGLLRDEDEDPGTRGAALHGLNAAMDADVEWRTLLVERARNDRDPNLCLAAQHILTTRYPGDPIVGALLAQQIERAAPDAGGNDETVRQAAVLALAAQFHSRGTAGILTRAAISDPAAIVRLAAAEELAERYGADADTRRLLCMKTAREDDPVVRLSVIRILIALEGDAEVLDQLVARLTDDMEPQIVRETAAALVARPSYKPIVVGVLRRRLQRETFEPVRLAAIDVLVSRAADDETLPDLLIEVARAENTEPAVFHAAVSAIVKLRGPVLDLVAILNDRLASGHTQIRVPVVELFGAHFGAEPYIRAQLIKSARNDDDVDVRRAAVGALGGYAAHPEVRALLIELIGAQDWSMRCAALHTLASNFTDDEELRELIRTFARTDPDEEFRRMAVRVLTCLPGADPEQLPDIDNDTAIDTANDTAAA